MDLNMLFGPVEGNLPGSALRLIGEAVSAAGGWGPLGLFALTAVQLALGVWRLRWSWWFGLALESYWAAWALNVGAGFLVGNAAMFSAYYVGCLLRHGREREARVVYVPLFIPVPVYAPGPPQDESETARALAG